MKPIGKPRIGQPIGLLGDGIVTMTLWLQQYLLRVGRNPDATLRLTTLPPSPALYTNDGDFDQDVVLSGVMGTEFTRNGIDFYPIGADGMFRLNPGDTLRITYMSTPDVTVIPR